MRSELMTARNYPEYSTKKQSHGKYKRGIRDVEDRVRRTNIQLIMRKREKE